jgi:hypothetical protein
MRYQKAIPIEIGSQAIQVIPECVGFKIKVSYRMACDSLAGSIMHARESEIVSHTFFSGILQFHTLK